MRKVFAFIGSPMKEKSNTYTLAKMMLDRLVEMDKNIEYDILSAGHIKLGFCLGCELCMTKGFCPQDEHDDVGMLKEKMAGADLFVLGTPIYGAGVTGQLKTFLDRVSILYLQKKLAGIPGVTVVTAGMSPREPIHEYLAGPMAELGAKVVATLDTTGDKGKLHNPQEARKNAEEAAEIVFPYATGEKLVESDEELEKRFLELKAMVPAIQESCPTVYEYWKENGMLELNSFAELLEKIRKEKAAR